MLVIVLMVLLYVGNISFVVRYREVKFESFRFRAIVMRSAHHDREAQNCRNNCPLSS